VPQVDISLTKTGPVPNILGCHDGDKITWTNKTGAIVTSFTMPICVSPKTNPAPIAVGATTQKYTIKKDLNLHHPYQYETGKRIVNTLYGTIDVS
jgi:hypothetical protein